MTDRYVSTGIQTAVVASPGQTILNLYSVGTTHRGAIYYMAFSASGTMADQLQSVQVQRVTVGGTGATVDENPAPVDSDAPAALLQFEQDHSVEPTFTASTELWEQDVHVRALAQVQLQPDGHLMIPAVADGGIAGRSFSANYVGGARATFHHHE